MGDNRQIQRCGESNCVFSLGDKSCCKHRTTLVAGRTCDHVPGGEKWKQQQWRSRTNPWTVISSRGVKWNRGRVGCWSILQRCIWWGSVVTPQVVPSSSRLQFDKILDLPCLRLSRSSKGLVYFNQNPANSRQCRRYPLTRRDKLRLGLLAITTSVWSFAHKVPV